MPSRLRILLCLVLLLPVLAVGALALRATDQAHHDRLVGSLDDALQLESARLLDQLTRYTNAALGLAADPALGTALRAPVDYGADTFAGGAPEQAARASTPLQATAERLLDDAVLRGSGIIAVEILDADGRSLGAAGGTAWTTADTALVQRAVASARPAFGLVNTGPGGDATHGALLPIAVRVMAGPARVVGALMLHATTATLVEPLLGHHAMGSSTEVYLVQRTADDDGLPISPLRFADAGADAPARNRLVPPEAVPNETPDPVGAIKRFFAPVARATRSLDYRGAETFSRVRSLEPVDWMLVARIDTTEAMAPLTTMRRTALATIGVAVLTLCAVWLLLIAPLARRMRRTAESAERFSQGQHENPIDDRHEDEIGDVARSIDRLATDLDSDRRKRALAEARLRHQTMHDDLTGLVNRRQAHVVIDTLSETPSRTASLVFLDLDEFKTINDLYGHAVGDEVLVALARRLESAIDMDATLARWGGDQFLVILPDTQAEDAKRVEARVRSLFDHPIGTSAGQHRLECCIGVASSTEQRPLDQMLSEAEAAMSSEKLRLHDAGTVDAFAARAVRNALEERRVELWMQPIVRVPTPGRARPLGAEALVRLRSRNGGIVPPGDFLGAVRKTTLGRTLDSYMMERCTEALARWRRAGVVDDSFRLSINITGASLRQPDLAEDLAQRLAIQGVPAANLIIEISEKTGDIDERLLDKLRKLGVGIALDDVGLEHSNIDRLVALSPDIAKLDRQWLDDPVVLPRLVDLCRELGMQLIAEGVETHAQLARLQALSVASFQGYLFDRPRPAVQFVERWGRLAGTSRPTGSELPQSESLSVVG